MSIRLKLLRKKLGITLEQLADKSGMTKSYLSKVERGLNTPSIAAALKLARALNVNVEELFDGEHDGQARYSLVRRDERQALVGGGEGPGYAVLTSQVGQSSLLPFLIQPPTAGILPDWPNPAVVVPLAGLVGLVAAAFGLSARHALRDHGIGVEAAS